MGEVEGDMRDVFTIWRFCQATYGNGAKPHGACDYRRAIIGAILNSGSRYDAKNHRF